MRRALRVPIAVGAPVLTAVLVGCLFRPPPSSQRAGNDAAPADARPGDARPTPDGHIVADAPGHPDASGLPDGSTTGACMPMQPIDSFDEGTRCGSGLFGGMGSASAAGGSLMMTGAGGSAAVCTWSDVPAASGFYIQLATVPAGMTSISITAGANTATINTTSDVTPGEVDLTFGHTPGSGTLGMGVSTPVFLGFEVNGAQVTGAYGTSTMTSSWVTLGTITFATAPTAAMVRISTFSTGAVTFMTFACI